MRASLQKKIEYSIDLLRKAEKMALRLDPDNGFCGSCRHFQDEDTDGYGWCSLLEKVKFCGNNWCPAWKKKEDDNSLIHSNSLESGKEDNK